MLRRIRLLPVLGALILTAVFWAGFMFARHPVRPVPVCVDSSSAAYTGSSSHCTASYLIGRDPYCLLDPTCASPFLSPHWQTAWNRQLPSFQGAAWVPNYSGPRNTYRMFAIPNYALFVTCLLLLGYAIYRLGKRNGDLAVLAVIVLLTWYGLEVLRWTYTFWDLGDWYGAGASVFDWASYAYLLATIAPLMVGIRLLLTYRGHADLASRRLSSRHARHS